jgi:amino acid transporter
VGYLGKHPNDMREVSLVHSFTFRPYSPLPLLLFSILTGWIAGIAQISSLPILFLSFLEAQFFPQISRHENLLLMYGVLVGISVSLAFVNYRGLDVVANATIVIFFLSTAPFVVLVIIGIPKSE